MDAIELLKEDHEKVSDLFDEVEETEESENNGGQKIRLFEQIKNELETHTHIEETIFYPACKQYPKLESMVAEALEEHKQVKTLLSELSSMNDGSEVFDAKLQVLQDNVEHHVEEEEDELFPKVRDEMTQDQIDELGAKMEAAKAQR
jgi:iron-sulfur cluster repair protein YtfE (RIC family)